MKIACVNVNDTKDRRSFGGRLYPMVKALESQSNEFHHLGPLRHRLRFVPRIVTKRIFYKLVHGKHYSLRRDRKLVQDYAVQLQEKLSRLDVDVIVSLVSTGSQPIAYLETQTPIVIWTDSTFAATLDFYPEFARSRLCDETIRDGLANEQAALERSTLLLYLSDWAAQSAITHYGIDPAKIRVLPVGPSFDPGVDGGQVERLILDRPADRCRVLFIGLEWGRKGGDVALEVAKRLNAAGLPTELTIVGCQPEFAQPQPPWVTVTGIIDISTAAGVNRLRGLLSSSHFLIVPSRAEAMGIVFCEASAFGVPSLTTNVGGIPSVVKDGRNGQKFDLDADPGAYCDFVISLFADYGRYQYLAMTSFEEYEARLNWDTITRKLGEYLHDIKPTGSGFGSPNNANWRRRKLAS